jgi:hypothetical protein
MPDFPCPEAASLILSELRKARDPAKTPQIPAGISRSAQK